MDEEWSESDMLISVIMPIFNRERYLDAAIASIVHQTYPYLELILVDDASTDTSWEIARRWMDRDSRIRLYRNSSNQGIFYSRNRGVQEAQGSYIAFLDSDDIAEPQRFEAQMGLLLSGYDLVGSSITFIDSRDKILGVEVVATTKDEIEKKMRYTLPLPNPTLLAKREVFHKVGAYRFPCAEDYDFFLRAYDLGFKATNYCEPLVKMRMHMQNTGVLHVRKQRFLSALVWKLHEERIAFGYEVTDSAQILLDYIDTESALEKRSAFYYRNAYLQQNHNRLLCMLNLIIACVLWPPNIKYLLRRFL